MPGKKGWEGGDRVLPIKMCIFWQMVSLGAADILVVYLFMNAYLLRCVYVYINDNILK